MSGGATDYIKPLRLAADPSLHERHHIHGTERIWTETNCYVDLWVELLNGLGLDPVLAFGSVFSSGFDGQQWTFLKPYPEDIRRLYGLDIAETNVWQPVLELVQDGLRRELLYTVEVDSWWLPDTKATDYRNTHVKTSIVPTALDVQGKSMTYLHGPGMFALNGEDFDGIFGLDGNGNTLVPYVEQIRLVPSWREDDVWLQMVRDHLRRRDRRAVRELSANVQAATTWLPEAGPEAFHTWTFGTLRQFGATAELAADISDRLAAQILPEAAQSAAELREVAAAAKSIQFKMARAAAGRKVAVDAPLEHMSQLWESAIERLANGLKVDASATA